MKFKFALFLICFSFGALSFDQDFKVINERVPLEFKFLFDSMKSELSAKADQLRFVGLCKELDDNLGYLPKDQIFMLMKNEVIKNVLQHKFRRSRQIVVSRKIINLLVDASYRIDKQLTPFSRWIYNSIVSELKYWAQENYIFGSEFNPEVQKPDLKRYAEALRLQKYLGYLKPWLDVMESLSPSEFNKLTIEVGWEVLTRLNERALLFRKLATSSLGSTKEPLFNIPSTLVNLHPEDIKKMQTDEPALTLKEEGLKMKSEAETKLQKITPEDLSPLSEDVAKELEKKAP